MLQGTDNVASLPDPIGVVDYASELDDGLDLFRVSCPIEVLAPMESTLLLPTWANDGAYDRQGTSSEATTARRGEAISFMIMLSGNT